MGLVRDSLLDLGILCAERQTDLSPTTYLCFSDYLYTYRGMHYFSVHTFHRRFPQYLLVMEFICQPTCMFI